MSSFSENVLLLQNGYLLMKLTIKSSSLISCNHLVKYFDSVFLYEFYCRPFTSGKLNWNLVLKVVLSSIPNSNSFFSIQITIFCVVWCMFAKTLLMKLKNWKKNAVYEMFVQNPCKERSSMLQLFHLIYFTVCICFSSGK